VATIDGIFTFSNPGGIGRWLKAGQALPAHTIIALWLNPLDPTQLIASGSSTSWQSLDGGQQWQPHPIPAMHQFIASRTAPHRILARDHTHAYLSHDAGHTWQMLAAVPAISVPAAIPCGMAMPLTSQLSHDGGATWQASTTRLWVSNDGTQHLSHTHNQWLVDNDTLPLPPNDWQAVAILAGTPRAILWSRRSAFIHLPYRVASEPNQPSPHTLSTPHPTIPIVFGLAIHTGRCGIAKIVGLTWQSIRTGLPTITAIASARLI
jgi:hypothetical protein